MGFQLCKHFPKHQKIELLCSQWLILQIFDSYALLTSCSVASYFYPEAFNLDSLKTERMKSTLKCKLSAQVMQQFIQNTLQGSEDTIDIIYSQLIANTCKRNGTDYFTLYSEIIILCLLNSYCHIFVCKIWASYFRKKEELVSCTEYDSDSNPQSYT